MKGTIAASLLALSAAQEHGVELAYDPMLLLCTDEEGGLYPGIRYLAEQGMLKGHIVNFNGSAAARIWAGCFGVFHLQVRIRGHAVHAGEGNRTGAGINAIEGALPILNALQALKPDIATRESKLPPPPHATGPLRPHLTISTIQGGTSGGQVPAEVKILVTRSPVSASTFSWLAISFRHPIPTVPTGRAGRRRFVSALGTGRTISGDGAPQAVRISGTCSRSPACRR
jgi:succinyl-diaminopimelate desuccinylase